MTPLHIASLTGHLDVVRLLVQDGADKDKESNDGETPLFIATAEGHLEIVRLLLQEGADKDKGDNSGETPLFMASIQGHLEIVRLLIQEGADKDKENDRGTTALVIAAMKGHLGTQSLSRSVWQGPHGRLGVVLVLVKQEGLRWRMWEQAHCGQVVQGL